MKKILFLDRDGVINKKAPEHDYITRPENFIFNQEIFILLREYLNAGFEIIIITNQRGIARNMMSEDDFTDITDFMLNVLKAHDIVVLDVYHCPHENNTCQCRKPRPGMLEMACKAYEIDLVSSILLSDSLVDVEMGKAFGIGKNILVESDTLKIIEL